MKLAQRTFSRTDQMQFASASGDRNPMHVDPLRARRTQAGAPVVHGIHMLLWSLDALAAARTDLPPLRSLRAQFNKFVYVDEPVEVVLTQQGETGARLSLSVDGTARSKLTVTFGNPTETYPDWSAEPLHPVPLLSEPLSLTLEEMSSQSGSLALQLTPADASELFPSATRWLGARRIAALAASTYLVGMICPGLHSIYSELAISTCVDSGDGDVLAFRVTDIDPRFRTIEQEIAGGGLIGTVSGFARMPPVEQATMESLAGVVAPDEFAGSVALIVGGSRGLGELTAKLIAAGGGRVIVTWLAGKEDAERVSRDICAAGGQCEPLAYDARKPAAEQLSALEQKPTHAYYFATPVIFRPQAEIFSADRLRDFLTVYVDGFWQLAQSLRLYQPAISLFYPSSVFVADRPSSMTEYSMAKAAAEVLCADMNQALAPLKVTVSRLPRLPTDQTASVTPADTADPVATLLPIVREVQSQPR
jgi:NAD(P)-dependent dehydrogenase (short-subunit alcohol dehydrogenase family)